MTNRKPIFLTSDWHIQHDKCIEFDQRPFKDMSEMIEVLVTRFNSTVPDNGITYFLGDMGMNNPNQIKEVIDRLNGTKILILGNHCNKMDSMYNAGFDAVMHGAVLYYGKQRVTMSHCPLLDTYREDCSKMTSYKEVDPNNLPLWHGNNKPLHRSLSFKNEGQFHCHGHLHSRPGNDRSLKTLGRQMDVGVCAWNYRPVSWSEIQSWIDLTLKTEKQV